MTLPSACPRFKYQYTDQSPDGDATPSVPGRIKQPANRYGFEKTGDFFAHRPARLPGLGDLWSQHSEANRGPLSNSEFENP